MPPLRKRSCTSSSYLLLSAVSYGGCVDLSFLDLAQKAGARAETRTEDLGNSLADIGKRGPCTQIDSALHVFAEQQQGCVFTRMIGRRSCGIAAVIGR